MSQRWLILAILTFARASIGFQFQSVAALSPFLLDQFELSYAALGNRGMTQDGSGVSGA